MASYTKWFGFGKEKSTSATEAAKSFRFYDLCRYLDDHPQMSQQDFHNLLDMFYSKTEVDKEDEYFSAYSLVCLLLPGKDRRKPMTKKMFRDSLMYFINVPIPSYQYADQWAEFVSNAFPPNDTEQNSVYDVNTHIMRMTSDRSLRNSVIQELCSTMNAVELRWLFRILLHEVSDFVVGAKNDRGQLILTKYLSPKAENLLQSGMDLESLCIGLYQSRQNGGDLTNAIILGKPVLPMLLSRVGCGTKDIVTIIENCQRPYYVEIKYDGEHFLLHRLEKGKDYKFFSRRGLEHSDATNNENPLSKFANTIHSYFKDSVVNCVLDGELVVKDTQTNRILGKNVENHEGKVFDVKHMTDDYRYKKVFVVFDLLMLNNEEYFQKPLVERLKALNSFVFEKTDQNVVFISEKQEVSKVNDLLNFYNNHLAQGEEGIVIKGKKSIYKFGQRSAANGWFKMKPDYGLKATIDCAVVGVRYEDATRTIIKSFEIAVLSENNKARYRVIGATQARLKKHDYDRLVRSLHLESGTEKRPSWIEGVVSERYVKYCTFENMAVVEVKASGVINNHLQFAVISCVRLDKFVNEIATWNEIPEYGQKLRSRKRVFEAAASDVYTIRTKKRRREVMNTSVKQSLSSSKRNTALKDKNVYLIPDLPTSKARAAGFHQMEEKLIVFGAKLLKNYHRSIDFAITPKIDGALTKSVIGRDHVHVISTDWFKRCIEADKVLKWNDDEVVFRTTREDALNLFNLDDEEAEMEVDEDSNVPSTTENESKEVEEALPEPESHNMEEEVEKLLKSEIRDETPNIQTSEITSNASDHNGNFGFDELTLDQADEEERLAQEAVYDEPEIGLPDDLFFGFCFYVWTNSEQIDENYKKKIEKCGGNIVDRLDSSVTHIFFQKRYDFKSDPNGIKKWLDENHWMLILADHEWIDKSISEEDRYLSSLPSWKLSL